MPRISEQNMTQEEFTAYIDKKMTEKEFGRQIEELARLSGWTYYHTWNSQHSQAGWPDYVLMKPPRIIYAELKTEKGKLTRAQENMLLMLNQCKQTAYLWRPSDWNDIEEVLRGDG
jgi:hypothetical protein